MAVTVGSDLSVRQAELEKQFPYWEKIGDCIDNFIDVFENYRQSGHPGGSRSKRHMFVALTLGGFMRWDIRHPEKRFGDRYVLVAGHTVPLVYATLAAYNTALRAKYERTGDKKYAVPEAERRQLMWNDLLGFRRHGGLAGHAEMEGKTLFLKFNTGPTGHGSPAAVGEAMALKRAGADGVKVFAVDGEGGLTAGASHESKNSAWGLGLDNLHYLIDWNDFGIDPMGVSDVINGTPTTWFEPYGFRVHGTEQGSEFASVTRALLETMETPNPDHVPNMTWFKTIKGRGYGVTGYKSHGTPHKLNSEIFWQGRQEFADKYGVTWHGFGEAAPSDAAEQRAQFEANLKVIADAITSDDALVDYMADRLVELGDSVPEEIPGFKLDTSKNPFEDKRFWDFKNYPDDIWAKPGASAANRNGFAKWGAYINSLGRQHYGRPLFIAMSADLSESTNIAGFAEGYGDIPGWGRYDRHANPDGALLPQEITEFTNSGVSAGHRDRQLLSEPVREVRRLLRGALHLCILLVSEIRPDASLQPTRPGFGFQGRQGALGGRPLRPGDGGGLPHALRYLLSGRDATLPGGADHQPHPVGVQRGAGACSARRSRRTRRSLRFISPGRRSRYRIVPRSAWPRISRRRRARI